MLGGDRTKSSFLSRRLHSLLQNDLVRKEFNRNIILSSVTASDEDGSRLLRFLPGQGWVLFMKPGQSQEMNRAELRTNTSRMMQHTHVVVHVHHAAHYHNSVDREGLLSEGLSAQAADDLRRHE